MLLIVLAPLQNVGCPVILSMSRQLNNLRNVSTSNRQSCVWKATVLVNFPMTFLTGDVAVMRQTAAAALFHALAFFPTMLAGSPHIMGRIAK